MVLVCDFPFLGSASVLYVKDCEAVLNSKLFLILSLITYCSVKQF